MRLFRFSSQFFQRGRLLARLLFLASVSLGSIIAFAPASAGLQPNLNDKALHVFAFFVLAALLRFAYPKHPWSWLILGLLTYGMLVECVQAFIPSRQFSLLDLFADLLGVLAYMTLHRLLVLLGQRQR